MSDKSTSVDDIKLQFDNLSIGDKTSIRGN